MASTPYRTVQVTLSALACLVGAAAAQLPAGVDFEPIYDQAKFGFLQPTFVGPVPGDPSQLIVVERAGQVYRLIRGASGFDRKPWFSVDANTATHWDGAWNVEFHPRFRANHLFYVLYRMKGIDTRSVLEEWTCGDDLSDPRKVRSVIYFDQKAIHSSGDVHFGKDGYLYSSQGDRDQGPAGGQLMSELWGKVIRIDVDKKDPGLEYAIPANPFRGQAGTRPEIWASGFRMPWRFSFDALTGDLYLGDVGDLTAEEIDRVEAGKNYGAGKVEGKCSANCAGLTDPFLELPHGCVIGGYVYRNDPSSAFYGAYIYADYQLNTLNAFKLKADRSGPADNKKIAAATPGRISTLGVDAAGNLYAATYVETPATTPTHIYRLKHAELKPLPVALARRLPQAGPARDGAYALDGRRLASPAPGLRVERDATGGNRLRISLP